MLKKLCVPIVVATAFVLFLSTPACNKSNGPTTPDTGVSAPVATATPAPAAAAPAAAAPAVFVRPAATNNGLTVETIYDEWDSAFGGSCHSNGGTRTFRLTNESDVMKYSNPGSFHDPVPRCGTQHRVISPPPWEYGDVVDDGNPQTCAIENGRPHIKPGEVCLYSVTVDTPDCGSRQDDNCWGPGGMAGCSFVYGDSFKSTKTCDDCVEDPVTTVEEKCGDYSKCTEVKGSDPVVCEQERVCTKTTTVDYKCKDDVVTSEERTETKPCECDCVEDPVVTTKCGDWNECHEHPGEGCFQEKECVEHTDYQCKPDEDRPFEETQPCPCECEDVFKFYIQNKEARTTTYYLSWGGSVTLNQSQTWNSGWKSQSSLTVTWVDGNGRNKSKTLNECPVGFSALGDVSASCHTNMWMKCDCVIPS